MGVVLSLQKPSETSKLPQRQHYLKKMMQLTHSVPPSAHGCVGTKGKPHTVGVGGEAGLSNRIDEAFRIHSQSWTAWQISMSLIHLGLKDEIFAYVESVLPRSICNYQGLSLPPLEAIGFPLKLPVLTSPHLSTPTPPRYSLISLPLPSHGQEGVSMSLPC